MYNITIARFAEDPQAQGVVRAADGSWQLVVDKDGIPHLYIRVALDHEPGEPGQGMLCLDDLLPKDGRIRDLMTGSFGGKLTPEEEAAAHAEYLADKATSGVPCPK